ncbi:MAG: hypothetical protein ACO1RA_06830 [Planctomycetaceae bacterium]
MKLEERMFAKSDTKTVIEAASHPTWHLDKAHAMYELAIRALSDFSLLKEAWRCIGEEIIIKTRQGLPLGQPVAFVLLGSGNDKVEESLVTALNTWSKEQQADFFIGLFTK